MKLENARLLLSQLNRSPLMAAIIGGGVILIFFGVVLNVSFVPAPAEQRKLWFVDLADPGWPAVAAGAVGWLTAFIVYHAWRHRYLLLAVCVFSQGYIVARDHYYARLWLLVVMLSILGAAFEYVQSD